jgi:hypothetical protein
MENELPSGILPRKKQRQMQETRKLLNSLAILPDLDREKTMPIVFQNPGLIDLRAVQIMGLNAKETKNPIGQFGTGLKYSIAVLLRTGCQVSIWRGNAEYSFFTKKESFRGKEFDFVYYRRAGIPSPVALGFTLELGKHWEPWMAIRELESNCRDEGGESFANADYQLSPDVTTIVISGSTAETAYSQLRDIFINTKPLWKNDILEIHPLENPSQANWLYYRGVRCQAQEKPALFRYNILAESPLTEDRTFRYSWDGTSRLSNAGLCTNREVIDKMVSAEKGTLEWEISYSEHNISNDFAEVVGALANRATPSAWRAVRLARGFAEYEEVEMDELQRRMLERAWTFIERMGERRIRDFPVFLAADLGMNKLGTALNSRKEIWLSTRVFEMGMKQLISCLYEEFIHLDRKLSDLDYEMQNFLFDTIITQAAKLQGEIL